jgi:predicted transcriptional regulator of viral defense system
MVKTGSIARIARGLYSLPDKDHSEHSVIAEIAVKYPHGILCLLSALRFHEIGTQSPFEVWFAVPNKAKSPHHEYVSIRTVRFSGAALTDGIDIHYIDGVPVKVTNPARTVADCFKFRNKIGLDVALEALQHVWRDKKSSMDDIWHFAETDRVAHIMRPYLESLL